MAEEGARSRRLGRKGLWLPPSMRVAYRCRGCEATFTEREAREWIEHVSNCQENEALLEYRKWELSDPMLNPFDPELANWVQKLGGLARRRLRGFKAKRSWED